jgi:iron-sulfur cluster assembly protein
MNYCKSKADVARLDEVIEDKGVRVIVDSKAFMAVVGTQMDFIED